MEPSKYTESWTIEREDFYQKLIDNELFWRKLGETCQELVIKMVNEESKNQKEE